MAITCGEVIENFIAGVKEGDDGSVSSKDLEKELKNLGCDAVYLGSFEEIKKYFKNNAKHNDMLITMGAGNIDSLGVELLQK